MKEIFELKINGDYHEVVAEPHSTLLEILREQLGLTGAKEGCGLGDCGACTVLVDGKEVHSCIMPAVEAKGKEITTIEGLAVNGKLDPLQKAFVEHGAMQCGFCTPGMILASKALLNRNPRPTEVEIRRAISGNICRCTGFAKIVEAVKAAAEETAASA